MKEKIEVEINDEGFGKNFQIWEIRFIEKNYLSTIRFLDEKEMNEFIKNLEVPEEFIEKQRPLVWID